LELLEVAGSWKLLPPNPRFFVSTPSHLVVLAQRGERRHEARGELDLE
jgi:hypothetical protein